MVISDVLFSFRDVEKQIWRKSYNSLLESSDTLISSCDQLYTLGDDINLGALDFVTEQIRNLNLGIIPCVLRKFCLRNI